MANEIINKVGLHELIEKNKLLDQDIMILQDEENTKKVTFRNLRDSLIEDNELPSAHRLYSSLKTDNIINDFKKEVNLNIGKIEAISEDIKNSSISSKEVDNKIEEFSKTVYDIEEIDLLKEEVLLKRDSRNKITHNDIETENDESKIKLSNLSSEVINAMTGKTPVTPSSVPEGGWVQEDIANGAINGNKLSKQYRYKGHFPDGNINLFVNDGLYLLGASVTGLPKYDENEKDQDRLLEVFNYGPDQYIVQKVYYCIGDGDNVRPVYIRKSKLNRLHVTPFVAEYPVTDTFKITRNVLVDDILNCGIIISGSIYDITIDGDYFIKKGTVKNLPNDKHDFTVSVRTYDTRIEYVAKAIHYDICEVYISNSYVSSSGAKERTQWYQTNTVTKSRFDGKTLHLFGDGVCFGMGSTNIPELSYPALLTSRYGINIINHALGDATIGVYDDEYLRERSVISQIENSTISNGDFIIIFAGSNDYKSGVAKIGKNSDLDNYTFKGALNMCIEKLMNKNPDIKVIIASPLFRARLDADDFRNGDETPINELYLRDYAIAMKEVCEYNHIPFLDLYSNGMINKYNFTNYLKDRLYLNDNGHSMIADKIFAALNYFY